MGWLGNMQSALPCHLWPAFDELPSLAQLGVLHVDQALPIWIVPFHVTVDRLRLELSADVTESFLLLKDQGQEGQEGQDVWKFCSYPDWQRFSLVGPDSRWEIASMLCYVLHCLANFQDTSKSVLLDPLQDGVVLLIRKNVGLSATTDNVANDNKW